MQTYRRDRHGQLRKGRWKGCSSADDARRRAERAVVAKRVAGAVALSFRTSGEFQDGEKPITIAEFGDVPAEARDIIPF
jgi:hypothetical protein